MRNKNMATYNIKIEDGVLKIGFGEPAQNDEIVKDAKIILDEMLKSQQLHGKLLKINGAASLPVAFVITHAVSHLYGAIAVYDPKLQKYVVSVSHTPEVRVGDLI